MTDIEAARRHFAEEVRFVAAVRSAAIVRAFATVPRERFLGAGPWMIASGGDGAYWSTPGRAGISPTGRTSR